MYLNAEYSFGSSLWDKVPRMDQVKFVEDSL